MKQNNSTEVSGSSFLNIYNTKEPKLREHMKIQIIGNPSNTKKQTVLVGILGFQTSTLEIEILLVPRGQQNLNFISPGQIYIYIYIYIIL